jgi:hypothetical protein
MRLLLGVAISVGWMCGAIYPAVFAIATLPMGRRTSTAIAATIYRIGVNGLEGSDRALPSSHAFRSRGEWCLL